MKKPRTQYELLLELLKRRPPNHGCMIWPYGKDDKGYGTVEYKGRTHKVHRLAYQIVKKLSLKPQQYVVHECDNPLCFRVNHLKVATAGENNRACNARGRRNQCKGERHP